MEAAHADLAHRPRDICSSASAATHEHYRPAIEMKDGTKDLNFNTSSRPDWSRAATQCESGCNNRV